MRPTAVRALLLLVLLALGATGCSVSSDTAASTGAPASAPTTSAAATATPEPSAERLLRSGPPRLGYVDGHVLRLPDGSEVSLPKRWGVTAIEEYAGGYLVTDDRIFEGTVGMQRLDGDGRVLESWAGTGPPLVSRDGRIAWVSLVAPESGRTGPTLLHTDALGGGSERTQEIRRDRIPFLTAWFRGRLVYRTWGEPLSRITDLVRPPRPIPLAEDLGVLSPDGRRRARLVDGAVELLGTDGQLIDVVRDRGLGRSGVTLPAWEDDRHLLTVVVRGRRSALARIDTLTGTLSLATGFRWSAYPGPAVLPAR